MLLNRRLLLLGCILISMTFAARPAPAWETKTHRALHDKAVTEGIAGLFLLDTYLKEQLLFTDGINESVNKMLVLDWIKEGAQHEDDPMRWLNHFHRPLLPRDQAGLRYRPWFLLYLLEVQGKSSIDWALAAEGTQKEQGNYSWYDARAFYRQALIAQTQTEREAAYTNLFRSLGQVMHLIEDAAVPDHTRNDGNHGPDAKLKGRESIETWVDNNNNFDSIPVFSGPLEPKGLPTLLRLGTGGTPTIPLPLANLIDADAYDGTTAPVATQYVIGLAEYASANFFSNDTIFHPEFPHPSQAGLGKPFTDESSIQYRPKKDEGVEVGHLVVAEGMLGKYRYSLDAACYRDYATELIPRAIQYAAAIPYYFFRGKLEVDAAELADTSGVTQVSVDVRNLSPDDLGAGTFTLYYDDTDGTRKEVGPPVVISGLTKTDPPLSFSFTPPGSRVNDTYTLVFQGVLGMEEGAVIGKVFTSSAYTFTTIDYPNAPDTYLFRITNARRILGAVPGGQFVYDLTTPSFASLPSDYQITVLSAMNDQGDLAGYTWDLTSNPWVVHGLILKGGQARTVDVSGANYTELIDINNTGDVVGYYRQDWTGYPRGDSAPWGFFLKAGGVPETILVEGSFATIVYGLNDRGDLVGVYFPDSGPARGFLRRDGKFTDITVLGALHTEARDINRTGEIVGMYSDASGLYNGFVLSNGRYSRIRYPGAVQTRPFGINDAGEITGCYVDARGIYHGFMATPRKKAGP